ncbi:MAG: hypothetical protein JSV20_07245 [Candidatus Bathyarchaeota archaeon]|nr:MAG: hypothetical protein JSV20_07245 [Candidatus Bathyarchaeota archaeon]
MVLPAKIFEITDDMDLDVMAQKLKDFHEEETYQTKEETTITLVSEIRKLRLTDDTLSGVFRKDYIRNRFYIDEFIETPTTERAPLWIKPFKEKTFMIVVAPSVARGVKKLLTSNVANKLSDVLFVRPWTIVEVRLPHETLKELHESNPQATRLIWFDEVDIPNIKKLCLAGEGLADTKLYNDYLDHGKIWYVVFENQKREIVVGITRNCVVTLFSKSTLNDFIKYITEDVLKLLV